MAIQISGTTIINNTKELDSGLKSAYPNISVSAGAGTVTNRTVQVVTGQAQTITLPASPQVGNEVCVMIQSEYLDNIVARNGQLIMGIAEDITMDIAWAGVTFLYTGSSLGWRIY